MVFSAALMKKALTTRKELAVHNVLSGQRKIESIKLGKSFGMLLNI
jgi:uncharacterized protein YpbB